MKIIGICGKSGSGKSTVSCILKNKGIPVLDCDEVYHDLVNAPSACLEAIASEFGRDVIKKGALDRNVLRSIVFSDPEKLSALNRLTHPFVLDELKVRLDRYASENCPLCVIDAPLFFESGLDLWCDFICAVTADDEEKIQRICQRDHISSEIAKERLEKQFSEEELRQKADFVLENKGNLSELESACDLLIDAAMNSVF